MSMKLYARAATLALAGCAATSSLNAAHWITAPSYYTHDPGTGIRVSQYTPVGPVYVFPRGDYVQSGYRHTRSSIQVGQSADNLHIVEEWGRPVRPYEEWRFPYRPYSVPYDLWGPPLPGFGFGPFGLSPYGRAYQGPPYSPGFGGPGHHPHPGYPGPVPPGPGQPAPPHGFQPRYGAPYSRPWEDGFYRPYPSNPNFRIPDRDYFSRP